MLENALPSWISGAGNKYDIPEQRVKNCKHVYLSIFVCMLMKEKSICVHILTNIELGTK